MKNVLKKKWGKPVTDVQRFVPQYCAPICGYYDLLPVTDSDIANHTYVSIDLNNDNIKQTNESNWSSVGTNHRAASSVTIFRIADYKCYEQIGWPGGTDFTNSDKYKRVYPSGTYCLFSSKFYKLGSDKYYDGGNKNQS